MTGVYNLNNGVKISELYKDLNEEQIESIEKAADGGFTVDELKSLEEDGIDTSLIKNNSTQEDGEKVTSKTQSKADVNAKIEELKDKYCSNLDENSGDAYSTANPELVAFGKLLDDGVIGELADEGFTKTQIVSIIGGAFPSIGVSAQGESGAYTRPYGHGEDAQSIYSKFSSQLVVATGEDSEEIKAAKAKLATLNSQIASNNHNMQVLEVTIEALQEEVKEQIEQAIEESKEIQEDHKKESQQVVDIALTEYSSGSITYEEFQERIRSSLNDKETSTQRKLGDVVCDLIDANNKMSLLKSYVADLSELQTNNDLLVEEANATKVSLDELEKEQLENASEGDPDASCTDPIGFSTDTARYDFFVDSDKNGDITNENEFLGAADGFSEVSALDTDNDGKVTAAELDAGNVKVIKTNQDGTQEVVSASEVFTADGDGIDLSSYQGTNQDIGNGNTLLGTFNATMNGQTMDGYQTLDSNEWLDENYEFTDEVEGKGRFAQDITDVTESLDMKDKINIFTITNNELETKLGEAWSAWGFSDSMAQTLTEAANSDAKIEGDKIAKKFEEIARKEEEKEQAEIEAQEEAEAEAAAEEAQEEAKQKELEEQEEV